MNTNTKHIATSTFCGMIAMALLVPQPAAAEDAKTYPGLMCRAASGEAAKFFVGSSNTDPNSGHTVTCAVVRDTANSSFTRGYINSASITVIDNSPVEDVECSLTASDGVPRRIHRTSGINSAPQTLQLGTYRADGAAYQINCRIPKASPIGSGGLNYSSIISYRVNEDN